MIIKYVFYFYFQLIGTFVLGFAEETDVTSESPPEGYYAFVESPSATPPRYGDIYNDQIFILNIGNHTHFVHTRYTQKRFHLLFPWT